jgi:predicted glycoside hydrolase/deacetylase ChbG (UPF0249 family)
MARCLIVNGDDFGVAPGVSRGIIRAHREGIVTSTSVMVTMPHAADAINIAHREAGELGLGLHLSLTAGLPVSPVEEIPCLIGSNGRFRSKTEITTSLSVLDMEQIELELRGQIGRFIALAGHPPDHLDSHHHITYLSPGIFSLMLGLAAELDAPIRYPFRTDRENVTPWMLASGAEADRTAIGTMLSELDTELAHSGVRAPDHAIVSFYDDHATLGDLLLILTSLPEGVSEMMCHPGLVDNALRASSGYVDVRETELAALIHPSAREIIETEGIELITFGRLGG